MRAIERHHRLSLRAQLTVWVTLGVLAMVAALAAWLLSVLRQDLQHSRGEAQRVLLDGVARDLDEKIHERRDALARSAAVLGQSTRLDDPGLLREHFASRPLLPGMFDFIWLADVAGTVSFDLPQLPGRVGRSIADGGYFKQILRTGMPVLSEPLTDLVTGEPSVVFAAPVRNRQGAIVAVLGGVVFLNQPGFLSAVGDMRIGREGHFALISKGEPPLFVMHGRRERILMPAPVDRNEPLARALRGFEGTVEAPNSQGVQTLRSYRSLHAAPWVLAAVQPTSEAYAGVAVREREAALAVVLLAALAGGLAWWLAGRLLAPLQQLEQALARPPGDAGEPGLPLAAPSRELAAVAQACHGLMQHKRDAEAALARSERWLRAIADNVPALIAFVDRDEVYRFTNAHYQVVFGIDPGTLVGQSVRQALGEAVHEAVRSRMAAALAGEPQCFERCVAWRGRDTWLQVHYVPSVAGDGTVDGFHVMTLDITERKRSERLLADSERMLRAITDNLPVLITYIDSEERLRFANKTFQNWLGIDLSGALGRPLRDVIGPARHEPRRAHLQRALAGERVEFELEAESLGVRRHMQIAYLPDRRSDGSVAGIYTLTTDVSAMKQVERQLGELARVDALTGLPNRRQFEEKLQEALARARRHPRALALMYLDIDQFKGINDSLGHAAGDAVLREFGARLKATVRVTDVAARLAGDEFVVLLEGVPSKAEAERVAQKIVEAIRVEFHIAGAPLLVTTSLGLGFAATASMSPPGRSKGESLRPEAEGTTVTAEALMNAADEALYKAKRAGRDGWQLQPCAVPPEATAAAAV